MERGHRSAWVIRLIALGGVGALVLSGPGASADRAAAPAAGVVPTAARPAVMAVPTSAGTVAPRISPPVAPIDTTPAPTTAVPTTPAPTTVPVTTPVTLYPPPVTLPLAERNEYLAAINAARAVARTCGTTFMPAVGPLAWDDRVGSAAILHSQDQSNMNLMTHTGSDGSSAGTRLTRAGFTWHGWGENVAWGYTSTAEVMTGWLGSAGHCSNLMNAGWTVVGMGRVNNFWTQDFARP